MKMRLRLSSVSRSLIAFGMRTSMKLPDHPLEDLFVGQVLHRAADAGPVRVEALAGDVVDDVVDELALVEAVEEAGERAEVERRRADAQQVVLDPPELA